MIKVYKDPVAQEGRAVFVLTNGLLRFIRDCMPSGRENGYISRSEPEEVDGSRLW
ncbi:MAG: hypothetical protein M2R45_02930 [Verrucomicrobia subdivision 3 bacterium]|nr:hypothetical protein [Limisphaerales bacterium]MCS1415349.1 hypothetical protein [Limisphaerales bacterium]